MIEKDLKSKIGRGLAVAGLAVVSGCSGAPQEKVVRAESSQSPYTIVVEGPNYRFKQVSRQGVEIWGWGNHGGSYYEARLDGLRALNEKCELTNWSDNTSNTVTAVTTKEDFCLQKFQR